MECLQGVKSSNSKKERTRSQPWRQDLDDWKDIIPTARLVWIGRTSGKLDAFANRSASLLPSPVPLRTALLQSLIEPLSQIKEKPCYPVVFAVPAHGSNTALPLAVSLLPFFLVLVLWLYHCNWLGQFPHGRIPTLTVLPTSFAYWAWAGKLRGQSPSPVILPPLPIVLSFGLEGSHLLWNDIYNGSYLPSIVCRILFFRLLSYPEPKSIQ